MANQSNQSNKTALKRLQKELAELQKSSPVEMCVGPTSDDNLFHWEGILHGPEDSPYSGGIFKFVIDFANEYPMKAPTVRFITKLFHPNISIKGDICVDILKSNWSSVYTVSKIMLSVLSLLTDPNPSSALNGDAARLYQQNRKEYDKTVKDWVKKFASPENL